MLFKLILVVSVEKKLYRRNLNPLALKCNYHHDGECAPKLYLMRRSLEVLRKFHWMILGGRFNQLSHVSSPLLSKPGEY
ncbi:hypothetical protein Tco_0144500 [Tanacetum coccineum]